MLFFYCGIILYFDSKITSKLTEGFDFSGVIVNNTAILCCTS